MVCHVSLHADDAHHGFQKGPDLSATEWPLGNSHPGGQIPAESPQAALQSQC